MDENVNPVDDGWGGGFTNVTKSVLLSLISPTDALVKKPYQLQSQTARL